MSGCDVEPQFCEADPDFVQHAVPKLLHLGLAIVLPSAASWQWHAVLLPVLELTHATGLRHAVMTCDLDVMMFVDLVGWIRSERAVLMAASFQKPIYGIESLIHAVCC